jgi:hypothetical protein
MGVSGQHHIICITCIMYQQLWGYNVKEKLYLGVREQKRLNTTDLDCSVSGLCVVSSFACVRTLPVLFYHSGQIPKRESGRKVVNTTHQFHTTVHYKPMKLAGREERVVATAYAWLCAVWNCETLRQVGSVADSQVIKQLICIQL